MDDMGQATAANAISKLNLRRVLFELLVLCGMDHELGFTRAVNAQGRPDAVSEAQFFLKHHSRNAKTGKYAVLERALGIVAFFAITGCLLWNIRASSDPLVFWLILTGMALVVCSLLVKSPQTIQVNVGDNKIYCAWIKLLSDTVSTDMSCGIKTFDTDHKLSLRAKAGSAQRIIKRVTDYRILDPSAFHKEKSRDWLRYLLLGLAGILYLTTSSTALMGSRTMMPPLGPMLVMGIIIPQIAAYASVVCPFSLLIYLVQHLLDQIQQEEAGASGAPAISATPALSTSRHGIEMHTL